MHYVQVTVRLKPTQRVGVNTWKFTLGGEERQSTLQQVSWFSRSHKEALQSINPYEVLEYTINLSNTYQ